MALAFEDLEVLKEAEKVADCVWEELQRWQAFERDTVGKQLVRSTDSIGANIAESFGRYHYGDRLRFLYYARGSLYETKYWLNRAVQRKLLSQKFVSDTATQLTELAKQLNSLAASTKSQKKQTKSIKEENGDYRTNAELFTQEELSNLARFP